MGLTTLYNFMIIRTDVHFQEADGGKDDADGFLEARFGSTFT